MNRLEAITTAGFFAQFVFSPLTAVAFCEAMVKRVLIQKKDKTKALMKKSFEIAVKRRLLDEPDGTSSVPANFQVLFDPITNDINTVHQKLEREEEVLKPALNGLSEAKLKRLQEIHEKKSQTYTEEKILLMAEVFTPEMELMDNVIGKCQEVKVRLLQTFIRSYVQEYSKSDRPEAVYDNEKFVKDLENALCSQRGFRRSIEVSNTNEEQPEQDTRSCVVM